MERSTRSSNLRTRSSTTRHGHTFTSYKSLAGLTVKRNVSNGVTSKVQVVNRSRGDVSKGDKQGSKNVSKSSRDVPKLASRPIVGSKTPSKDQSKVVSVKTEPKNDEVGPSAARKHQSILKNSPTNDGDSNCINKNANNGHRQLRNGKPHKKCVRICVPIKEERMSIEDDVQNGSSVQNGCSDVSNGVPDVDPSGSNTNTCTKNDGRDIRIKTRALNSLGLVPLPEKSTSNGGQTVKTSANSVSDSQKSSMFNGLKSWTPSDGSSGSNGVSRKSASSSKGGHQKMVGTSDKVYKIEKILKSKRRSKNGLRYFLVKWKNWPSNYNSWEPETNFDPEVLIAAGFKPSRPLYQSKVTVNCVPSNGSLQLSLKARKMETQFELLNRFKSPTKSTNGSVQSPSEASTVNVSNAVAVIPTPSKVSTVSKLAPKVSTSPLSSTSVPKVSNSAPANFNLREPPPPTSLESLVPKKILTIEPTRQGLVVLMKWINYPLLSWLDYEWVKGRYPNLCFEYHESMIRFRSRPIDIDVHGPCVNNGLNGHDDGDD